MQHPNQGAVPPNALQAQEKAVTPSSPTNKRSGDPSQNQTQQHPGADATTGAAAGIYNSFLTPDHYKGIRSRLSDESPESQIIGLIVLRNGIQLTYSIAPLAACHHNAIFDYGFIPRLLEIMRISSPIAKSMACEIVGWVCSGAAGFTDDAVKMEAFPVFMDFLKSAPADSCHNALCALANFALEGEVFIDLMLNSGIIELLISLIKRTPPECTEMLTEWTRVVLNLCFKNHTSDSLNNVLKSFPYLFQLIRCGQDQSILEIAFKAISTIFQKECQSPSIVDAIIKLGLPLPNIMQIITENYENSIEVAAFALQILGCISMGGDQQNHLLLICGVLKVLKKSTQSEEPSILQLSFWILFNIAMGSVPQFQAFIDADFIPRVIEVITPLTKTISATSTDKNLHAVLVNGHKVLTNSCFSCMKNHTSVNYLVRCGIARSLCALLKFRHGNLLSVNRTTAAIECVLVVCDAIESSSLQACDKNTERQSQSKSESESAHARFIREFKAANGVRLLKSNSMDSCDEETRQTIGRLLRHINAQEQQRKKCCIVL